jgi:hypothetical protein
MKISPNEKKTSVVKNQHTMAAIIRVVLKFYKEIAKLRIYSVKLMYSALYYNVTTRI